MAQLVRAPAHRAGDPSLNPGPGENFSLKLLFFSILEEEQRTFFTFNSHVWLEDNLGVSATDDFFMISEFFV